MNFQIEERNNDENKIKVNCPTQAKRRLELPPAEEEHIRQSQFQNEEEKYRESRCQTQKSRTPEAHCA